MTGQEADCGLKGSPGNYELSKNKYFFNASSALIEYRNLGKIYLSSIANMYYIN